MKVTRIVLTMALAAFAFPSYANASIYWAIENPVAGGQVPNTPLTENPARESGWHLLAAPNSAIGTVNPNGRLYIAQTNGYDKDYQTSGFLKVTGTGVSSLTLLGVGGYYVGPQGFVHPTATSNLLKLPVAGPPAGWLTSFTSVPQPGWQVAYFANNTTNPRNVRIDVTARWARYNLDVVKSSAQYARSTMNLVPPDPNGVRTAEFWFWPNDSGVTVPPSPPPSITYAGWTCSRVTSDPNGLVNVPSQGATYCSGAPIAGGSEAFDVSFPFDPLGAALTSCTFALLQDGEPVYLTFSKRNVASTLGRWGLGILAFVVLLGASWMFLHRRPAKVPHLL